MAAQKGVNNWGQVLGLVVVLVGFVVLMSFGLILRDYKLTNTGEGLHWVAKVPVPRVSGLHLSSEEAGKLEMKVTEVAGVDGYEFRVSRFKNMWFAKSYRTTQLTKELGMMSQGKIYYVQVRGYKKLSNGRTVFGLYSSRKGCTIRQSRSKNEHEK